jgi:hypothetical protein
VELAGGAMNDREPLARRLERKRPMHLITGDEALKLWKQSGLWDNWALSDLHIAVSAQPDGRDLRIYYGQKGYAETQSNFVVVFQADNLAEWRAKLAELVSRGNSSKADQLADKIRRGDVEGIQNMVDVNVVTEGQHRQPKRKRK